MEQCEFPTSLGAALAAELQGVSQSHRFFLCFCCKEAVKLCRKCDRGNIYCSSCHLPQKQKRISRARKSYKKSQHGLKTRALANKRRRARKIALSKNEGDRGSPSCTIKPMTPEPAIPAVPFENGVPKYDEDSNGVSTAQTAKVPPVRRSFPTVSCSKCGGPCLDFQKKSPGRFTSQETERLLKWLARYRDPIP